MPPPLTPTTGSSPEPVRYLNEAECRAGLRVCLAVTLLLAGEWVAACIVNLGAICFVVTPVFGMLLCCVVGYYHFLKRVRQGEKIPAPAPRPVSTRQDVAIMSTVFALVTAGTVWLSLHRLLPILHSGPLLQVAAVHLLFALTVTVAGGWFFILREDRRRCAPAVQSAVPVVASQTPAETILAPHHWWTNTDTREEIQQRMR